MWRKNKKQMNIGDGIIVVRHKGVYTIRIMNCYFVSSLYVICIG